MRAGIGARYTLGVLIALTTPAFAIHYLPDKPEIDAWYASLMMPDQPQKSCCGVADAYWADEFEVKDGHYVAVITDERKVPGRTFIAFGTRILIPDNKLPKPEIQKPNPTGHGIVFMNYGNVYCYFPPAQF